MKPAHFFLQFLRNESAGGMLLMAMAAAALVVANSPLAPHYFDVQHVEVLGLSVLHWINDALMAVFFLLVGMELKRELLIGQLDRWPERILPGAAALGGMIVPALIYAGFSQGDPEAMRGWAVPMATDIAFALGVLVLLGSRVPVSLKVFLTALAIIDDLGAIIVIALFYTDELSLSALAGAAGAVAFLMLMNRRDVQWLPAYLVVGAILWMLALKSGIHATIAGVVLALTIPLRQPVNENGKTSEATPPLLKLEHALHPWVAFLILPIFGFANAGVSLSNVSVESLMQPVTLGITAGLFLGKQLGVFGFAWLAIQSGHARLPKGASYTQLFGVSALCGIGFTMSLFIGLLAFGSNPALTDATKIGVLLGSLLSAIAGAMILRLGSPLPKEK